MSRIFNGQIDTVSIVNCIGFMFLAGLCVVAAMRPGHRSPWIWLGGFGIAHGVCKWLDLFVSHTPYFLAIRISAVLLSFVCLAFFIRAEITCIKKADVDAKQRMIALSKSEKRAEENLLIQTFAANAVSDQIIIIDGNGIIKFVNLASERETGYNSDEIIGTDIKAFVFKNHKEEFFRNIWETIQAGNTWHGEIINRRKDGSAYTEEVTVTPIRGKTGSIEHFIAIKRNITEKKRYEQQLDHLAHHDPLTGLPNRLLFSDRLTQSLEESKHNNNMLAVVFIDLDRFKLINETLGHNTGDLLLKQLAWRLTSMLREADTIARMGGDEFALLIENLKEEKDSIRAAQKILDAFNKPFTIEGHELFVTASVGVSVFPADGMDIETLVRNADASMYRAKEQGRNTYHLYTEALNVSVSKKLVMEHCLRKALEREEFLVQYQPKVDIRSGRILGVEALIRWQHPKMGLTLPNQFIPLAEETGLIAPISEWIINAACAQNKTWQNAGLSPIDVAVNISARQFQQGDLASVIRAALDRNRLDPQYLSLELTESLLINNPDRAVDLLYQLKDVGIGLSLDDFGTGYSSLSYLKRFPVDAVKIDQSFVREITSNPDDAAIAGAIVAMAHSLNLKVIAEGVETLHQFEFLKSLNCDEMQGYFISRPVPANEIAFLMEEQSRTPDIILFAA